MELNRQNFLSFWTIFWPFTPSTTQKIKILKKWKKHMEALSFYTSAPQMKITWCMVPEIWSMTDRIFCHFGPFFAPFAFYHPNNPKNQNFEKLNKRPGDTIISSMCTKNHDHMLYCSLDIACNRCNCYFSFWSIFCPFASLTA